jgi:hypothetical protein
VDVVVVGGMGDGAVSVASVTGARISLSADMFPKKMLADDRYSNLSAGKRNLAQRSASGLGAKPGSGSRSYMLQSKVGVHEYT